MKYYYVYQVTNLVNNRIYIGVHSTSNLKDGYLGSGKALNKAIKKYGKDNFSKEILDYYDSKEEAYEEEEYIVTEKWIEDRSNYNIVKGGRGGTPPSRKGVILSDETKKKMSAANGRRVLNVVTGKEYTSLNSAAKDTGFSNVTLHNRLKANSAKNEYILL